MLRLCTTFKVPTLEELEPKFVFFGPKERTKTLILDMDETLIHAKFLEGTGCGDREEERLDDGDFIV